VKVSELRLRLATLPDDAEVKGIYDGADRLHIEYVWLARSGEVMLADQDAPVYSFSNLPCEVQGDSVNWTTPSVKTDK
jgi:hypothetical protein